MQRTDRTSGVLVRVVVVLGIMMGVLAIAGYTVLVPRAVVTSGGATAVAPADPP